MPTKFSACAHAVHAYASSLGEPTWGRWWRFPRIGAYLALGPHVPRRPFPGVVPVQKSQAEPVTAAANPVRVIKKYPNRRLYDTETSAYITLSEVKALVMRSEPFVVRDAKTNDDLTRSILLQIILEEETAGVDRKS